MAVERFTGKGGTFVRGRGRLIERDLVEVGDQLFRARRGVVLGTGTVSVIPPIDGLAGSPFWTNREAIAATELPESLIVLGGGAIGVELAQVFARFSSKVTIVEAADRLLPLEEPESGELLAWVFTAEGMAIHAGVAAREVRHDGSMFTVDLADGTCLRAARLLVATGRKAEPDRVGASVAGVASDARWVPVDDHQRVTDGVWAVGDLTGKGAFTHIAMYQSAIVVADILGEEHEPADYRALPRVTFTDPEVGSVGLTEQAAREAGIEVLGLLVLAVHAQIPISTLRSMFYAYPTFRLGIEDALRDLRQRVHAQRREWRTSLSEPPGRARWPARTGQPADGGSTVSNSNPAAVHAFIPPSRSTTVV